MARLDQSFFERDTAIVARDLLGRLLVHESNSQRVSGRVVEAEAYSGWEDRASHGYGRVTPRNAVMFGSAGVSYIYIIYGNYWMLNVVAKPRDVDYAGAVLIRAIEPVEGLEIMAANRPGHPKKNWTNGPGKLVLAMGIDESLNRIDLTAPASPLFFEEGEVIQEERVRRSARVGLGKRVPEPWKSKPWRFYIADNPYVSRQ